MDSVKPKIPVQDALLKSKLEQLKQKSKNPSDLKKAANDFEAIFVNYMLQNMRKTVMKSGLLDSGLGGEIMLSLFDEKLSENIAQNSNLGIAELLMQQLSEQNGAEASPALSLRGLPLRRESLFPKLLQKYLELPPIERLKPFGKHIEQAARKNGVDRDLIRAVIMAESGGNPRAVSGKKARGLMQLIDSTATQMGVRNVFDPEENIHGGVKYLAQLLKRFKGNTEQALAAYNAGPSAVAKHGGIPPYKETRRYVEKVMSYYRQFKKAGIDRKK
ncbi:MAG TPA: hypothetical protein ENK14_12155 [Caldithrix sp.]|nr:hypothetical protein [Caldithrix sp.]